MRLFFPLERSNCSWGLHFCSYQNQRRNSVFKPYSNGGPCSVSKTALEDVWEYQQQHNSFPQNPIGWIYPPLFHYADSGNTNIIGAEFRMARGLLLNGEILKLSPRVTLAANLLLFVCSSSRLLSLVTMLEDVFPIWKENESNHYRFCWCYWDKVFLLKAGSIPHYIGHGCLKLRSFCFCFLNTGSTGVSYYKWLNENPFVHEKCSLVLCFINMFSSASQLKWCIMATRSDWPGTIFIHQSSIHANWLMKFSEILFFILILPMKFVLMWKQWFGLADKRFC